MLGIGRTVLPKDALEESLKGLIRDVLQDQYHFIRVDFRIEKEARKNCPNNHIFYIHLSQPLPQQVTAREAPSMFHTCPIPAGTTRLLFRVRRGDAPDGYAVRRLVGSYAMARASLAEEYKRYIPRVFGWQDAATNRWVLEEFMEGQVRSLQQLEDNPEAAVSLFDTLASMIKQWQSTTLPKNLRQFGSIAFDDHGVYYCDRLYPLGGPYASFSQVIEARCKWQLAASERNRRLGGYRENSELRARLDKFISEGLPALLERLSEQKPTFTHGSLFAATLTSTPTETVMRHLRFDKTMRLSRLVGMDSGFIGAPGSEFHASLAPVFERDPRAGTPKFPQLEKAFTDALNRHSVQGNNITDDNTLLARIWSFSDTLCRQEWCDDAYWASRTNVELETTRKTLWHELESQLSLLGY